MYERVPILVKTGRSGSTWLGKILQALTGMPFELELGNAGDKGARTLAHLVNKVGSGIGFSLSVAHKSYSPELLRATTRAWRENTTSLKGRAAVIVLHRRNLVKHAVATQRWNIVGACNRQHGKLARAYNEYKRHACISQPHSLLNEPLRSTLQCLFRMEANLDSLAAAIATPTGLPVLLVEYEDMQVNFDKVLQRIREHLHINMSRAPQSSTTRKHPHNNKLLVNERLDLLRPEFNRSQDKKSTDDDLRIVLANYNSIGRWLNRSSSCLAKHLSQLSATFPVPHCKNPWANQSWRDVVCGFPREGASWYAPAVRAAMRTRQRR